MLKKQKSLFFNKLLGRFMRKNKKKIDQSSRPKHRTVRIWCRQIGVYKPSKCNVSERKSHSESEFRPAEIFRIYAPFERNTRPHVKRLKNRHVRLARTVSFDEHDSLIIVIKKKKKTYYYIIGIFFYFFFRTGYIRTKCTDSKNTPTFT